MLQGCVLWHNWWPLLTAFMYVLVPMPYLFFGSASGGSSSIYGGSSLASGCATSSVTPLLGSTTEISGSILTRCKAPHLFHEAYSLQCYICLAIECR